MNVLGYLASKPPWVINFTVWDLITGATAFTALRILEILAKEDKD